MIGINQRQNHLIDSLKASYGIPKYSGKLKKLGSLSSTFAGKRYANFWNGQHHVCYVQNFLKSLENAFSK